MTNRIELTSFSSPVAPYNEIVMDAENGLLLDVIYNTGRFVADDDEMQLYANYNGVQVVFQTVGNVYQPVTHLLVVVQHYFKSYLNEDNISVSFFDE